VKILRGGRGTDGGPHVLLAVDEGHTIALTKSIPGTQIMWSNFTELRHALRSLHHVPIFCLVMSTTSKISQFTPPPSDDWSKRIHLHELILIQPFTVVGFDPFAKPVSINGGWNLEELTSDFHIAHLGRPM
jgi:hypothetical protein